MFVVCEFCQRSRGELWQCPEHPEVYFHPQCKPDADIVCPKCKERNEGMKPMWPYDLWDA